MAALIDAGIRYDVVADNDPAPLDALVRRALAAFDRHAGIYDVVELLKAAGEHDRDGNPWTTAKVEASLYRTAIRYTGPDRVRYWRLP